MWCRTYVNFKSNTTFMKNPLDPEFCELVLEKIDSFN